MAFQCLSTVTPKSNLSLPNPNHARIVRLHAECLAVVVNEYKK